MIKTRLLSIAIGVLMIFMISVPGIAAAESSLAENTSIGILGDVDLDGTVTVRDATAIQKHLAGLILLADNSLRLADANNDSDVNIKDATEIQKQLADLPAFEDIGKEIGNTAKPSTSDEEAVPTTPDEAVPSTPDETIPSTPVYEHHIPFTLVAKQRIQGYELDYYGAYLVLVKSTSEFDAVLDTIYGEADSPYHPKPVRDAKYNDEYFESNSLVVALYALGSGSYTYSIDNLTVCGDVLTIHKTIYVPEIGTCDMNYQYVLIEASNSHIDSVTTLSDSTTYNRVNVE